MRRCSRRIAIRGAVALLAALGAGAAPVTPALGQDAARVTFAQLADSVRANSALTQGIRAYAGKPIEIDGFIIPAGPPDLSFFLLGRVSATGNYCCEAPSGQDEVVHVYRSASTSIRYDPLRVYAVRGIFEAGHHVDPRYGVSLFRIRDARVEEAVGAKIFKVGE